METRNISKHPESWHLQSNKDINYYTGKFKKIKLNNKYQQHMNLPLN